MSIQSSINQMLSSIANQQLLKGLTTKVGEIKTDTGSITDKQKLFNELVQKHGSFEELSAAADLGKREIEDEIEARKNSPYFDDAVQEMWRRVRNIAQTRTNMERVLGLDTQNAVKERYEQSKGGAQK